MPSLPFPPSQWLPAVLAPLLYLGHLIGHQKDSLPEAFAFFELLPACHSHSAKPQICSLLLPSALVPSEHCWSGSHGCADCCHHDFTALQLSWAQGLLRVLMVPLAHPLLFSSVIFLSSHGLLIPQSLLRENRVTTSSVIPLRFFYLLYN